MFKMQLLKRGSPLQRYELSLWMSRSTKYTTAVVSQKDHLHSLDLQGAEAWMMALRANKSDIWLKAKGVQEGSCFN